MALSGEVLLDSGGEMIYPLTIAEHIADVLRDAGLLVDPPSGDAASARWPGVEESALAILRILYVLRRLLYLLGRRTDVRLVVTRQDDRAQRRVLDQSFPDEATASAAGEQLEAEIRQGRWPVG